MQILERILYAEDDPDIQQVALLALETVGGFTIEMCNSGLDAVAKIEAFDPQLLLLDVMMPDMDGPSAYAKILEMDVYKAIPTVFMTAKIRTEEVKRYLNMGAVDVLNKPFDPMTLAAQIQEIWERTQN